MAKTGWVWDGTQFIPFSAPVSAFPNAILSYQSASPTGPKVGHMWNDTQNRLLKVWTGSTWVSYAPSASPSFDAKVVVNGGSSNWSETIPGTTTGSIHLNPNNTTDNFGSALTFGASDAGSPQGSDAQAGVYIRSDV